MYEKELIGLSKSGARYLVVGGIALALHGYLRSTVDLDILPDMDSDNLDIIVKILGALGYTPRVPINPEEIKDPQKREFWRTQKNMEVLSFINLKTHQDSVDIVIYHPLDFEECYKRRYTVHFKDTEVTIASLEDLLALKKIAMRPHDLKDIMAMERLLKLRKK